MSGTTAEPYRVLFHHLAAGVVRCRLIAARDQVAAEILDSNAAFEPFRAVLARLIDLFAQVCELARPEVRQVRTGGAVLSVSACPVGRDEVIAVIEDVTARELLEQRWRQSQDRFEQAFHGNAAAMVIAHQSDLRIIDVNPRWLELFQATRDEVIGRNAVELGLITEARARTRIAEHKQFVDGYDTELELRTRTGTDVTVLASAKPIEIAEGSCTLTTLIDITSRKHAEEAFAVAFSASPAGMMLVDATSDRVVAVNHRLLEMTGAAQDQLVGRHVGELTLIFSPSREELRREFQRSGRLNGVEVELARNGGPGVWALASTETIKLHDKVHRLTVFTDIAARKQLERRLRTQNVIGRSLAETSDLETGIPRVLEALCRGEGWDRAAAWLPGPEEGRLQCRCAWGRAGDDEDDAFASNARVRDSMVRRVLATSAMEKVVLDAASGAHHAIAFPILRGNVVLGVVLGVIATGARDGDQALDAGARGLLDSVGRLLGLFVERTRAEASLRELNSELERRVLERTQALETSNRDLEAFSSSVSHDLRAPLRAIHGFSEILLEDFAELPSEARDLIAKIHASGGRLRSLIENLLAFSRFGSGALRRTAVDLDAMVRSVLDELLVGRELGDRLELRVMPLGSCHADPSLLRPVWMNLIDNALKYSRNRERIVIEIGREQRGGDVVYYVCDNGIGFDPKDAERLFGVFERLHAASEFEGTGIGLANVRRIVERHHGRVAATSEPGRGSRFEFTLGRE